MECYICREEGGLVGTCACNAVIHKECQRMLIKKCGLHCTVCTEQFRNVRARRITCCYPTNMAIALVFLALMGATVASCAVLLLVETGYRVVAYPSALLVVFASCCATILYLARSVRLMEWKEYVVNLVIFT